MAAAAPPTQLEQPLIRSSAASRQHAVTANAVFHAMHHQSTHKHAPAASSSRLLQRDLDGGQSGGHFRVLRTSRVRSLFVGDLFHTIVNMHAWRLFVLVVIMYFLGFLVFTPLYYTYAPNKCSTGFESFLDAFYFSVITMMTIGYGAGFVQPECSSLVILIAFQSVLGTILDAVAIGFIYDRLSAARVRGDTIIFSKKAILKPLGVDARLGIAHFALIFRFVESRSHQLTEAHVRSYAVRHNVAPPAGVLQAHIRSAKRQLLRLSAGMDSSSNGTATPMASPCDSAFVLAPLSAHHTADALGATAVSGSVPPGRDAVAYFVSAAMKLSKPSEDLSAACLPLLPQEVVHRIAVPFVLPGRETLSLPAVPHPLACCVSLGPTAMRMPAPGSAPQPVPLDRVFLFGTATPDDDTDACALFSPLCLPGNVLACWSVMQAEKDAAMAPPLAPPTVPAAAAEPLPLGASSATGGSSQRSLNSGSAPPPDAPGHRPRPSASFSVEEEPLDVVAWRQKYALSSQQTQAPLQAVPDSSYAPSTALTPHQKWLVTRAARDALLRSWRETALEVLCLVEGIDEITSDTCQARHSYTADEVVWNGTWSPCVVPTGAAANSMGAPVAPLGDKVVQIDFEAFHGVETVTDAFHEQHEW